MTLNLRANSCQFSFGVVELVDFNALQIVYFFTHLSVVDSLKSSINLSNYNSIFDMLCSIYPYQILYYGLQDSIALTRPGLC